MNIAQWRQVSWRSTIYCYIATTVKAQRRDFTWIWFHHDIIRIYPSFLRLLLVQIKIWVLYVHRILCYAPLPFFYWIRIFSLLSQHINYYCNWLNYWYFYLAKPMDRIVRISSAYCYPGYITAIVPKFRCFRLANAYYKRNLNPEKAHITF